MVARTADTQLDHSLPLLAATAVAMILAFAVPALSVLAWPIHRDLLAAGQGGIAWLAMIAAYRPTVRRYGLRRSWLLSSPLAALLFIAMTLDSARQHRRGTGGRWKGRVASPGA